MGSSFEQIYHRGPFFLHGFEGHRRVDIQTDHRLVKQGHVCAASFQHPNRITGAECVI
jgi:hypothetical protein